MGLLSLSIVSLLLQYRYWVIFPVAIIEGPMLMVLCGFFYRLGYFDFLPLYSILFFGDFIGDIAWYGVGRFGAQPLVIRYGKFFSLTEEVHQNIAERFRNNDKKILFISKITMGFGFALATLITAGMSRVPFKRFAAINFLGGLIWTATLLLVGYLFGNFYYMIDRKFQLASIVFLVILLAAALYGLSRYLRNHYASKRP
jgi:membrane-associated protein